MPGICGVVKNGVQCVGSLHLDLILYRLLGLIVQFVGSLHLDLFVEQHVFAFGSLCCLHLDLVAFGSLSWVFAFGSLHISTHIRIH